MALTRYAQTNIYNISSSFTSSLPVSVSNIVTVTGSVASSVTFPSSLDVVVTNLPAVQTVTGSVATTVTFPESINVNLVSSSVTQSITGQVSISNLPATQTITGSVTINNPVSSVTVSNFPSTQSVTGTIHFDNTSIEVSNLPVTQSVYISNPTTTVAISNFPADQTINGTVSVSNLPVTQSVYVANQISSVSVSNLPTTQSVFIANNPTVNQGTSPWVITGSVASNVVFPESMNVVVVSSSNTQTVTGTITINNPVSSVAVSNLPTTQSIYLADGAKGFSSASPFWITGSVTSTGGSGPSSTVTADQGLSGSMPWKVREHEQETFIMLVTGSAIGSGKSMASIVNAASGKVVRIKQVKILNVQSAAITGILGQFQFLRITGHSGGTDVTPISFDTADTLDASITCKTNATVSGEAAAPLLRYFHSTDEYVVGTADTDFWDYQFAKSIAEYEHKPGQKAITLRNGQGLSIKQTVASTAGTFDIEIIFTEDTE